MPTAILNMNINCRSALIRSCSHLNRPHFPRCLVQRRHVHSSIDREAVLDGRTRLSRLWVPTGGITPSVKEDSHAKLLRAGFLRQAHPGVFHLLPLGRRVLNKLEALIDKYMYGLGASKVELSSISSQELWSRSGRLHSAGSELFRFEDRKDVPYLLSPTHEEEITSLVSSTVKSYKEFPIRLYQTTRKYRDELRPRHGLLRSREFVMKDLYTFDYSSSKALVTYYKVRDAYVEIFKELKLPFLVAEADSGDMGGNLSHEFHFPTSKGEDHVISCSECDYVANEELAESATPSASSKDGDDLSSQSTDGARPTACLQVWRGVSRDRKKLINVWYSSPLAPDQGSIPGSDISEINTYAMKAIISDIDSSVENPLSLWPKPQDSTNLERSSIRLINLVDNRLPRSVVESIQRADPGLPIWPGRSQPPGHVSIETITHHPTTGNPLNLLRIKDGDSCPRCIDGALKVQKAIELGHTFHLGSRYSDPMSATISVPIEVLGEERTTSITEQKVVSDRQVPFEMGCHGIGVSRMIGAVADTLVDEKGLNWPRVMAPFEAVVVPSKGLGNEALEVYDVLSARNKVSNTPGLDIILDDRAQSFPWKMQDADLVGYPVIIVVGRRWKAEALCEVQCRRLGLRVDVGIAQLHDFVEETLAKL